MVSLNGGKQRRFRFLTLCFFSALILLIVQTVLNVKDINDGWILEGIWPYFLLLTLSYGGLVGFSSNSKFIAIITSVYLATIVLIPNLKYSFIYGYHDPIAHYGFIKDIISFGHVPDTGFYASQYGSVPGSHILVSTISLTTGLDAVVAMKIFLVASASIIPLAVYLVLKKLNTQEKLSKIVIIATAISFPAEYIFTGLNAVYPILALFIYFWLLLACRNNTRSDFLIATLFGIGVVISHDVTSFFLLVGLLLVLFVSLFTKTVRSSRYSETATLFNVMVVSLILAHFVFVSNLNFSRLLFLISNSIESLFIGSSPVAFGYYQGFFVLTLLERLQVLIVRLAQTIISLSLVILSPLAIFRLGLKNDNLMRFYRKLTIPAFVALLVFILPLFIRPLVSRGLIYMSVLMPFLVGITIYWFICSKHYRFEKAILALVVVFLLSVSAFQVYPLQPLIPTISTNQTSYYVADWRQVSTIYTRTMILFTYQHDLRLSVTTDTITRWEIYGLTDASFQSLLSWRSDAPLVLISRVGKARAIASPKSAILNDQYLSNNLYNSSLIYDNGQSYVFLNTITGNGK